MTTEWQLQFRGRSRYHMLECWLDSFHAPQTTGMPGCGVENTLAVGRDGEWSVYVGVEDTRRVADDGMAFVSDPAAVAQYAVATAALSATCMSTARDCVATTNRYGVPDARLADAFARFFDAYTALQGHYQGTSQLFTAAAERLLEDAVGARMAPDTLSLLTYGDPRRLRSFRESVRWLELVLASRREGWNEAERNAALARHAEEYQHVGALSDRLGSDPLELCRLRWRQDSELPQNELRTRLTQVVSTVERTLADRCTLLRRLGLDTRTRHIADGLATLGVKRLEIREEFTRAAQLAYQAFAQVFARLRPGLDDIGARQLSRQEVIDTASGDPVPLDRVRRRLQYGFYRVRPAGKTALTGPDARTAAGAFLDRSGPVTGTAENRLSGLVVSGDRAISGPVRVLHRDLERGEQVRAAERAKPEEILVVAMTYPALAPACARVAGIVTDFGGLTCHAAVIARAAGVPCIVGTRHATSWLKTGDVVRLDLDAAEVVLLGQPDISDGEGQCTLWS